MNVKQLIEKAEKAFSDRDSNRNIFDDCYEYYSPYRNTLNKVGGTFNTPSKQYDSTGQISAANFVNTLQREFTPPFTRWSMLQAGPGTPENVREGFNKQLEKITEQVFAYINASNFSTASAEMYWELGAGTGVLWLYEGDQEQPLNFVAAPVSQMGLLEGRYGTIDFRCRRHSMKGKIVLQTWPKAKISEEKQQELKRESDKDHVVTECFYYDYELLAWKYCVILENKEIIFEDIHKTEICFTPRWMKIPGFAWGIGPFVMALADVKTLNILKEFLLRGAALDIAGVYTITNDGGINPNTVNIAPNTFIPVERNGGENGPTIQRLETGGNFQLQEYIANNLQDQIRKTMLDNRLPAETPQPKTAFEIAERMKEFQVDIGSAYGRLMLEFIIPLWKRVLDILVRKGLINLPEDFNIENFFVQVQVTSSIAQVQKIDDLNRFMKGVSMIAQIRPELILTAYEIEKLPAWVNEMVGAPTKLLRSDAEREQMQQAVMQMIAQAQQAGQQPAPPMQQSI